MDYSDDNLMRLVHNLFHEIRKQHEKGKDKKPKHYELKEKDFDCSKPMEKHGHCGHHKHEHGEHKHGHGHHHSPMGRERILIIIDKEKQISQNKLAEFIGIRPQSISELLIKLENDGYITRTKNEEDKREILISLTETGKQRAKEVAQMRAEQISKFFSPLSIEEKEQLFKLLTKLTVKSEEISP